MPIKMPIIPIGRGAVDEGAEGSLPVFYMGDFSVMVLRVGDYPEALRVLADKGIRISNRNGFSRLLLDDRRQLPPVVELLNAKGISCEMADGVERIYQG
jgi:hypothetical protein